MSKLYKTHSTGLAHANIVESMNTLIHSCNAKTQLNEHQ